LVVAVDTGTNVKYSNTTNSAGIYTLQNLNPGTYRVEASRQGFSTVIHPDVTLHVQDVLALNLTLPVGSELESITINEGTQLIQTETTTLGTTVGSEEVAGLPLVNRNYTQILGLSPGVAGDVTNAAALGRGSQDVYVNGVGSTGNSFQMDGVLVNNYASNKAGDTFGTYGGIAIPNPDAIQEFKVQTSLYDATNGQGIGANVNVVTKTGTNSFHGTVFEFFRNDALNANDYFSNLAGQKRSVLRQNQFGVSLGGPVLKNKLFFFGSYQGTRQIDGVGSSGNQSAVLPAITNDRSATTLGAEFCGQSGVFGGATVACDGSNINPVALSLLNYKLANGQYLIPTPQVIQSDGNGFSVFSIPARSNENQFLINTDYVVSPKHTFSERVFISRTPETIPFLYDNLPGSTYIDKFQNDNVVLKLTSILSPSLVNEAKFGFIRNATNLQADTNLTATQFGITPADAAVPGLPSIGVGNDYIDGTFDGAITANNNVNVGDQLSWTRGRHYIRAGFDTEIIQFNIDQSDIKTGDETILSFPDLLLGESAAQNGSSVSNVYGVFSGVGDQTRQLRAKNWGLYIQDDFKVNSHLTLNAGLRWDIFGGAYDTKGREGDFWPQLANNNFSSTPNYTGFVVPSNYKGPVPTGVFQNANKSCCLYSIPQYWGPRIGLAWTPFMGYDKLVIRSGWGMFHLRPAGNEIGPVLMGTPPFSDFLNVSGSASAASTLQVPYNPAAPPDSAFPLFIPRTSTSSLGNNSVDPNFGSPLVQQFSLNVEEQLRQNFLLEVGYLGSRGVRLNRFFPYNQASLATVAAPINGVTTSTVENIASRVPVVGESYSTEQERSSGGSWYNALIVSLTKRLEHGLQFQASYTYDKGLDDVSSSIGAQAVHGGAYDANIHTPHEEWGPSDYDRPQRFVFSYLWAIPAPHVEERLLGQTIHGWQLSGVTTIQDGHRLTVSDQSSGSIYGGGAEGEPGRAQLCPGMTNANIPTHGSLEQRLDNYINPSAFCSPPAIGDGNDFGGLRRGVLAGPGQDNTDIAVIKDTHVGGLSKEANIQFRAEFFNAFNHPQFADPTTGCGFGCGIGGSSQINASAVAPRIIQFALKYNY
jgi:hypothetical protein